MSVNVLMYSSLHLCWTSYSPGAWPWAERMRSHEYANDDYDNDYLSYD